MGGRGGNHRAWAGAAVDVDLDYFGRRVFDVQQLLPAAEEALIGSGYEVRREQIATETGFARLEVLPERGDPVGLDLSHDYRMRPAVDTELGRTLHQEELPADKVLALFGRAEARDFTDVDALASRFGHRRLLQLAAEKDPGFSPEVFGQMMGRIGHLSAADLRVPAGELEGMRARFERWRAALLTGSELPGAQAGARPRPRTYYRPRGPEPRGRDRDSG